MEVSSGTLGTMGFENMKTKIKEEAVSPERSFSPMSIGSADGGIGLHMSALGSGNGFNQKTLSSQMYVTEGGRNSHLHQDNTPNSPTNF
jgi:hypothetical protein